MSNKNRRRRSSLWRFAPSTTNHIEEESNEKPSEDARPGVVHAADYLHAGSGEDQANLSTRSTDSGGHHSSVSLNTPLRSDRSGSGTAIIATVMQDVPLGRGETLRAGSQVAGHVIETNTPGTGSDEAKISFQFDQVRFGNRTIPITTTLRAVASRSSGSSVTPELTSAENADYTIEIGGDQISYGEGGPVIAGSQVVGKYTRQGVLAYVDQDSGTPSGGTIDDNARPQEFWLFQ